MLRPPAFLLLLVLSPHKVFGHLLEIRLFWLWDTLLKVKKIKNIIKLKGNISHYLVLSFCVLLLGIWIYFYFIVWHYCGVCVEIKCTQPKNAWDFWFVYIYMYIVCACVYARVRTHVCIHVYVWLFWPCVKGSAIAFCGSLLTEWESLYHFLAAARQY